MLLVGQVYRYAIIMEGTKGKKELNMDTRASTSQSFAGLAIGLWTVSLIGYLTSGISGLTYVLIVFGGICALFGLYLILHFPWKQESTLEFLRRHRVIRLVKLLGWFIVLVMFGVGLVQTKVVWLVITGLITIVIIAFVVFFVGLRRMNKD